MENHRLVLPEHLNHYGFLFGGHLLKWVDEFAYIAATMEYQDCNFVTIGMDSVEFKKSVQQGTILKFIVEKTKKGTTSLQYLVHVYRSNNLEESNFIFSTHVTFVRVDEQGNKISLGELKD
jgi:acyl-CoA hydrolase